MSQREAPEEVSLVDEIGDALDSGEPLDLLGLASTVIAALTEHRRRPMLMEPDPDDDIADLDEVLASFIEVDVPETTAILAVFAQMLSDPGMRAECARVVAERNEELPRWLAELSQATAYRAVVMSHVLGDGIELLVAVRLEDGQELTCAAHIDHLMMSELSDAFFVPGPIDEVLTVAKASNNDPDTSFADLDLADVGAGLDEAFDLNLMLGVEEETETWPSSRALVEWLTRLLPSGGTNPWARHVDSAELDAALDKFFGSLVGMPFNTPGHREMLEGFVIEGTGDPLRWSAPRIVQLLDSAMFYDPDLSVEVQLEAPDLMRAYVPFAHAQSGIRQELTVEATDAIDESAEDYAIALVQRARADDGEQ